MEQVAVGAMLAHRRKARRMSQLDLALEAGVSARHLSFVETGRSRPSRDMVLTICSALGVAPRERNDFLLAAGYAPAYRETPLDSPQMEQAVAALAMMLRRNEPFPAVVFDRGWDLVMANPTYARFLAASLPHEAPPEPLVLLPPPRPNLLRHLFGADGYRGGIANWQAVAGAVLTRVRREIARDGDAARRALLAEIEACPGVPRPEPGLGPPPDLVIPVELRDGERSLRLLSTIAVLGTAEDLTLQELRIETFHPADAETERLMREAVAFAG